MAKADAIGERKESRNLELSLFRTFLAVVEHGTMGKTATAARISQPTVSAQVLRLEKIVGHRLFNRSSNGAKLTSHGELLIGYANRAVDLNEEALSKLHGESADRQVTLGLSTEVALVGFAGALDRLRSIRHNLELKIVMTTSNKLGALLKAGKLDLAIGDPAFITKRPAATWLLPFEWAAGKDFEIDPSRPLPLVLFESPCSWQDDMLNSLSRAGWTWRVCFESGSLDAILAATQSALGVAALPAAILNGKLARVQNAKLPPAPQIQFGLFRTTSLPSAARTVLEIVLDSMFGSGAEALIG